MVGLLISVYVVNVMKEMVGLLYDVCGGVKRAKGGRSMVGLRPREGE